jgi:hypothetical protein
MINSKEDSIIHSGIMAKLPLSPIGDSNVTTSFSDIIHFMSGTLIFRSLNCQTSDTHPIYIFCIDYSVSFLSSLLSFICCFIVIRNATIKAYKEDQKVRRIQFGLVQQV